MLDPERGPACVVVSNVFIPCYCLRYSCGFLISSSKSQLGVCGIFSVTANFICSWRNMIIAKCCFFFCYVFIFHFRFSTLLFCSSLKFLTVAVVCIFLCSSSSLFILWDAAYSHWLWSLAASQCDEQLYITAFSCIQTQPSGESVSPSLMPLQDVCL